MSDAIEIPAEFPPLPEPPAGHHWVPRGWGYESKEAAMHCVYSKVSKLWIEFLGKYTGGMSKFFYVSAVPNADQRDEVARLQTENRELREALSKVVIADEEAWKELESMGMEYDPRTRELTEFCKSVLAKHGKEDE